MAFTYTNMPSPTKKFDFGGTKVNHGVPIMPNSHNVGNGLAIFSMSDQLNLAFTLSRSYIHRPEEFVDIFQQKIKELVYETHISALKSEQQTLI